MSARVALFGFGTAGRITALAPAFVGWDQSTREQNLPSIRHVQPPGAE